MVPPILTIIPEMLPQEVVIQFIQMEIHYPIVSP